MIFYKDKDKNYNIPVEEIDCTLLKSTHTSQIGIWALEKIYS